MIYAKTARPVPLPPPSPTDGQVYSVPRKSGGFDYYVGPPGSSPGFNDDYPVPNVAHPNPIGISSLTVGRVMAAGATKVGSGERAVGSVTAMPGAGGVIPNLSGTGSVDLASGGGLGPSLFVLAAACAYFWMEHKKA